MNSDKAPRQPDIALMEAMQRLLDNPDFQRYCALLTKRMELQKSNNGVEILTSEVEVAKHNVGVGIIQAFTLVVCLPQLVIEEETEYLRRQENDHARRSRN